MSNYSENCISDRDFSGDDRADFRGANLRSSRFGGADFREVDFRGADLTGVSLVDADCRGAVFTGSKLPGATFGGADCRGAGFSGSDLTSANLVDADCRGAVFTGSDLTDVAFSGADLTGAVGLPEAPIVPDIDAQILREIEKDPGRFDMGHWCGTTLCRGGFAILLAGEAGQKLADRLGFDAAASLIYNASRPGHRIPDWYVSNEEALEDLRAATLRG